MIQENALVPAKSEHQVNFVELSNFHVEYDSPVKVIESMPLVVPTPALILPPAISIDPANSTQSPAAGEDF